jgi:hypothetical protein
MMPGAQVAHYRARQAASSKKRAPGPADDYLDLKDNVLLVVDVGTVNG